MKAQEKVFVVSDAESGTILGVDTSEENAKHTVITYTALAGRPCMYETYSRDRAGLEELQEAIDGMNVKVDWLETQAGTHVTLTVKAITRLMKAALAVIK